MARAGTPEHPNVRPVAETKRMFLDQLRGGQTVARSCAAVGRSVKTYEKWRVVDLDFRAQVDRIRYDAADFRKNLDPEAFPTFAEFSEMYLGNKVFPHTHNMIDLIEGREPGWLHPAMTFEQGNPRRILINTPPHHAKTQGLSINYVVYRIAKNPNIRVIVISKTLDMAKKFLFAVKERLTEPQYAAFHAKYGPPGGYKEGSESWSQTRIYISPESRTSGEKDPTVQALGIGGQIYGSRADLIIMDDTVDSTNSSQYETQINWINSQVTNRLKSGTLIVVGTRLAPKDLYKELRNTDRYLSGRSPWTYLSMPAVLEYADQVQDWVTLWPKADVPEVDMMTEAPEADTDGLYPMWDGPALNLIRDETPSRVWALVYMQQDVLEDAIFHPDAVNGVVNRARFPGLIPKGMPGCRENGMEGLVVVAGMDPAMAGFTAAHVWGLDMRTQKRYVLNVHNKARMTPDMIRSLIFDWTDKYGIVEWRIEKNAFQSMLTQDREINEFLRTRGAILVEHTTGRNKWDGDFGVASLSTLFVGWEDKRALIELPSQTNSEAVKSFIEQLTTWAAAAPKTQKTDTVMAAWFVELACRDRLRQWAYGRQTHFSSPFVTPHDVSQQRTLNLSELQAARSRQLIGA